MPQASIISPDQEAASVLRSGKNVFITGSAGSGKTFICRRALQALKEEGSNVILAAPTGIAADAIGGITLHRLLGLSGPLILYDETGNAFLQKAAKNKLSKAAKNKLSKADIVFVDEVSMVPRPLFDILAREIFSEISQGHMVLLAACGDFLQLPPVILPEEKQAYSDLYQESVCHGFAFQSEYWEYFHFHPIILKNSFRQEDARFCSVLNRIRTGDKKALRLVRNFTSSTPVPDAIWICGRKNDAHIKNDIGLQKLEGEPVLYYAVSQGNVPKTGLPAPQLLVVKPHMPIIMTANDPLGHYVNGSMGYVISTDVDCIYVSLNGTKGRIAVHRRTWKSPNDTDIWEFSQFPIDAAFALTVHRAQGMTLEKANICPYCWESGQLYVMLSRIRNPKQMYLADELKEEYLVTNSAVVSWYKKLNEDTSDLASSFLETPIAGFKKIPCNLYRRGLRFGVYTLRFALNGQPVSRSFVALRDEKNRWIAVTDFSRYCKPAKSIRPITSDIGDRLYFISIFLNYAFIDVHSISTLDEITPEIVRTFLNAYATGVYGNGKRTVETINRCTSTVLQFLLALLDDRGSRMLLTREDLFKKKCFFSSRNLLETKEVLAFPVQYDAESHLLLRDMPVRVVEYLLSYIWKYDPDILLAVALQLFAGLRPSEPLSISENELCIHQHSEHMVSVKINLTQEKILREDGVMTEGIKKHRIAEVYPAFLPAFADCWKRWKSVNKDRKDPSPLCLDTNGNAMTYLTYYRRFKKAVEDIIPLLRTDPDIEIRDYALLLLDEGAAPHILRHVFTVTLVLSGLSEAEIMHARGDTSPLSALTYLSRKSELSKRYSETANNIAGQMLKACKTFMEARE